MKSNLNSEFIQIIKNDPWMIKILKIVRDLDLNDCWVGAGFVRNKIWDYKHNINRTELNDIDVIHFDKNKPSAASDLSIEKKLKTTHPALNWSVKNQARMHIRNHHKPYANCNEAISFWPETATSIAVRLNLKDEIEYIAPYDLEDLFNLLVIPTPDFDVNIYLNRIQQKSWKQHWNKLNIKINF